MKDIKSKLIHRLKVNAREIEREGENARYILADIVDEFECGNIEMANAFKVKALLISAEIFCCELKDFGAALKANAAAIALCETAESITVAVRETENCPVPEYDGSDDFFVSNNID